MNYNEIVEFNTQNVTIGLSEKGYGHTYFATQDFMKGDKIMQCYGKIINHQTAHASMQIGYGCHFLPEKWTGKNLNHSSDPNVYIHITQYGFPALRALHPIKKGDEITVHYAMREQSWEKNSKENQLPRLCKASFSCHSAHAKIRKYSSTIITALTASPKTCASGNYHKRPLETIHIPAAVVCVAA